MWGTGRQCPLALIVVRSSVLLSNKARALAATVPGAAVRGSLGNGERRRPWEECPAGRRSIRQPGYQIAGSRQCHAGPAVGSNTGANQATELDHHTWVWFYDDACFNSLLSAQEGSRRHRRGNDLERYPNALNRRASRGPGGLCRHRLQT